MNVERKQFTNYVNGKVRRTYDCYILEVPDSFEIVKILESDN